MKLSILQYYMLKVKTAKFRLQTTQPTSGGAVTVVSSCCANCVEPPRPQQWHRFTVFWACRSCGPAGWLALLLTKAGDVETNPGPTTLNKKVWICDICHKQIHVRKQISIRCNRIEHWVHLRCAGIRQAQYTDTWTCHLHRESRLTPHTDITPPHRSRHLSKPPTPLSTYTTHTTATKTQTHVQHSPCPQRIGKAQTQFSHPLTPLSTHTAPSQTHTHVTHSTNTSHKHVTCTRQNTWTTCTTHTRSHCNHTSPRPHTSTAVTLPPSHSHSTHTCNTNNSTCITVTATTARTT